MPMDDIDRAAHHRRRGRLIDRLAAWAAAAALLGAAPLAPPAAAQATDQNPLASVKRLACRFPVASSGSWKNGAPAAQIRQGQEFSLEIDEIDADGGEARVTTASGPVHVTALLTISSLHFMERSVTGTLNVTTVFAADPGARRFRAVHSRHDYLPMSLPGFVSEPSVSQSYGECEAP